MPSSHAGAEASSVNFSQRDKTNSGPLMAAGRSGPETSVDNIIQRALGVKDVLTWLSPNTDRRS